MHVAFGHGVPEHCSVSIANVCMCSASFNGHLIILASHWQDRVEDSADPHSCGVSHGGYVLFCFAGEC